MKLEFPLNDALPNTTNARDRFLAQIFRFRKRDGSCATDQDFELLYAYGEFFTALRFSDMLILPISSSGHGPTVQGDFRRGRRDREAIRLPQRGVAAAAMKGRGGFAIIFSFL